MATVARIRAQLVPRALAPDPGLANLPVAARAAVVQPLVLAFLQPRGSGQDAPGDQRRGSSGRPTSQPGRYRARGRPSSGRTPARIADGGGHDQSSQPARRPASRGRRCGSRFVSGGAAGPDLALPVDGALQVPSDGDRRATFANGSRAGRASSGRTVSSQSHSSSPMRPIASATARCARYIASSEAERI